MLQKVDCSLRSSDQVVFLKGLLCDRFNKALNPFFFDGTSGTSQRRGNGKCAQELELGLSERLNEIPGMWYPLSSNDQTRQLECKLPSKIL